MTAAAHILVSGIVQGVGYRYWTERTARELGLLGWVRNLHDGRVEILVEGEVRAVDTLIERCARGPRSAHVSSVIVERVEAKGATAFVVDRDAGAD